MTQKWLIFKGFTGPITHFFGKATLKTNPTHFLNFLFGPVKNFFMAKLGQIVAKSDPNLANLGYADLPVKPLFPIHEPSKSKYKKDLFMCRVLQNHLFGTKE